MTRDEPKAIRSYRLKGISQDVWEGLLERISIILKLKEKCNRT